MNGTVYLIGAGPGDLGLMTVRGLELIKTCDAIVYDYLANKELLGFARSDAEIVYVGKKGGDHTLTQDKINELIVGLAKSGKSVARLKGGDPYVFGRGGEEAEELLDAGVKYEVVPGVTAGVAAAAYAGIPITHRSATSTMAFVTGHEDPTKNESSIAWDKIATGIGTIVFYMGVKNLPKITANLIKYGRDKNTPVAVIRWGTRQNQQTWTGTLETIAEIAKREGIKAPSLIVVGEVVKLREKLGWFENRPLFGKKIIVTRARAQASGFLSQLKELGATAIEFPTIETVDPDSWDDIDDGIDNASSYDWIIFTSVNGVGYLLKRLKESGRDIRQLAGPKIAAIGKKTAEALRELGIRVDLVPDEFRAEGILEKIGDVNGKKILIPRAEKAREILPKVLEENGATVDVATAYKTIRPDSKKDEVLEAVKNGEIDFVTFTSSSTVVNFKEMFSDEEFEMIREKVKVASIGPITSDKAREFGYIIEVESSEYTINGLLNEIVGYYSGERK